MSDMESLILHLAIAAVGSWAIIWGLRWIWKAVNSAWFGGRLQDRPVIRNLYKFFDTLLPVIAMVPAGLIFMLWPSDAILPEPIYRFLVGCVAGSVASNLYEAITRAIEKRVKDVFGPGNGPPAPPTT